jgi:hypothetical protein
MYCIGNKGYCRLFKIKKARRHGRSGPATSMNAYRQWTGTRRVEGIAPPRYPYRVSARLFGANQAHGPMKRVGSAGAEITSIWAHEYFLV